MVEIEEVPVQSLTPTVRSRATPDAADSHGRHPQPAQAEQFLHYRSDCQVG